MPDLDRPTNPDAPTTLFLRFETAAGSRTVVANGISLRDATLIATTVNALGQYAEFQDAGPRLSLSMHMVKFKRARARKRKAEAQSNVVPIKKQLRA